MTPSRGSKFLPRGPGPRLSLCPHLALQFPLQIREMSCSATVRVTSQHHPHSHGDGRQVRQRTRRQVRPREGLGCMRAEAPAPSLTRPEGKADKEASQSPAEQRPPHGNLLRAGLQEPPLHLTLALVLPRAAPVPVPPTLTLV